MWLTRAAVPVAVVVLYVSSWSAVVSAHGTDGAAGSVDPAVPFPFFVAIGLSAVLGVAFGLATVARYRPSLALERDHHSSTRVWVTVLLIALGVVALLSAVSQQWILTLGGGVLGGVAAWFGRTHGLSPHGGCADAALGAVLTHRAVEGVLVAGVYAASITLGLLGLGLLTAHAIAETVAIGGLYAPVSRGWAIASVVGLQFAFVAGALLGEHVVDAISAATVTTLLAIVGGVLLVAGVTEFRSAENRGRDRCEA